MAGLSLRRRMLMLSRLNWVPLTKLYHSVVRSRDLTRAFVGKMKSSSTIACLSILRRIGEAMVTSTKRITFLCVGKSLSVFI